jgi:hypothetical protein
MLFLIDVRCLLFKTLNERQKIAGWRCSKDKEMQMVRHYAIGVHQELVCESFIAKCSDDPFSHLFF